MARSLFWKVRVALSALAILIFIQPALSQSPAKSITYTCKNANLESVFEFLSQNSNYDFVYSSNLIDITRPVTLSVKEKSVEEILKLIEKQVNVSFKLRDQYIIVKSLPKAIETVKPIVVAQSVARQEVKSLIVKNIPSLTVSNTSLLQANLDRRINELQEALGPQVPRDIPPVYVNRINFNTKHRGWYASVGTFVNDNTTGVEFQAGLPFAYAVIQPRWSVARGFYGVYGIGNSFQLMRNLTFNTIYMYSGYTKGESVYPYSSPTLRLGPEFQLTQTSRHHQVKFAIQYAVSKNLTVRAGPVLNYKTFLAELVPVNATPVYEGTYVYRQPGSQQTDVIYQNGRYTASSFRTAQSYLGWEGAVSYRLNFFRRR